MAEASTIILALLALAGPLVGVWMGRYMERSNEATKWRRDRCLEAYTDVLATCNVVLTQACNAFAMEEPTPQAIAQNTLLMTKVTEMHRAQDKASLIASRETDAALRRLTGHYFREIALRAIEIPKPSTDEWNKIIGVGADLYGSFAALARKDLGSVP